MNTPVSLYIAMSSLDMLRSQSCNPIEQSAVTAGYSADRQQVLKLLSDALATELACVLRYRRHHFIARGMCATGVANEYLLHANEGLGYVDRLAGRIVLLGGDPDFSLDRLSGRSHAQYVAAESLLEMIKEDLMAERIAIDSYRELIQYLSDEDPTTRQVLKQILAVEEEHADELVYLLETLPMKPWAPHANA